MSSPETRTRIAGPPQEGQGASADADRATRASTEPQERLGHTASVPSAGMRRTIQPFSRAPRDGTPFHTLGIIRFNPGAKRFEWLSVEDEKGGRKWLPVSFFEEPTVFINMTPVSYELPASFAFALTFEVRPKTWRERLSDWLLNMLRRSGDLSVVVHQWRIASAIEARRAADSEAGAVEDESAVPERQTPDTTTPSSQEPSQ